MNRENYTTEMKSHYKEISGEYNLKNEIVYNCVRDKEGFKRNVLIAIQITQKTLNSVKNVEGN